MFSVHSLPTSPLTLYLPLSRSTLPWLALCYIIKFSSLCQTSFKDAAVAVSQSASTLMRFQVQIARVRPKLIQSLTMPRPPRPPRLQLSVSYCLRAAAEYATTILTASKANQFALICVRFALSVRNWMGVSVCVWLVVCLSMTSLELLTSGSSPAFAWACQENFAKASNKFH